MLQTMCGVSGLTEHRLKEDNPVSMKAWVLKNLDYVSWDRIGMGLSILCALHCLLTPLVILSIPFIARYYLDHPMFHIIMATTIIPVGLVAFGAGIRHHKNWMVLALGLPGLVLVSVTPYLVHILNMPLNEQILMVIGSVLLVWAHLLNRKSCQSCSIH
jgi:hypothetical protein